MTVVRPNRFLNRSISSGGLFVQIEFCWKAIATVASRFWCQVPCSLASSPESELVLAGDADGSAFEQRTELITPTATMMNVSAFMPDKCSNGNLVTYLRLLLFTDLSLRPQIWHFQPFSTKHFHFVAHPLSPHFSTPEKKQKF